MYASIFPIPLQSYYGVHAERARRTLRWCSCTTFDVLHCNVVVGNEERSISNSVDVDEMVEADHDEMVEANSAASPAAGPLPEADAISELTSNEDL
ncbi:hypothetical protein KIN20_007831 [Parelaphostrongylus tenuis]|uniref:Uncharacterized protein n=1 Tax=Parelaphostrongylus tenuis TaxID=148309 RepID=A0AAD5MLY7_PARTN|nr:hypothetical protein KIN20_007831 [Parelaphostrongylus tenuis]